MWYIILTLLALIPYKGDKLSFLKYGPIQTLFHEIGHYIVAKYYKLNPILHWKQLSNATAYISCDNGDKKTMERVIYAGPILGVISSLVIVLTLVLSLKLITLAAAYHAYWQIKSSMHEIIYWREHGEPVPE